MRRRDLLGVAVLGVTAGSCERNACSLDVSAPDWQSTVPWGWRDLISLGSLRIRVGEQVQLRVLRRRNGASEDLTAGATGTRYRTTQGLALAPDDDGLVVCTGKLPGAADYKSISVENAGCRGSIGFQIYDGPGPTLDVRAHATELQVGEATQLRVRVKTTGLDVSLDPATRFFVQDDHAADASPFASIDAQGRITNALPFEDDRPQYRYHLRVVVRNGDLVGWTDVPMVPLRPGTKR